MLKTIIAEAEKFLTFLLAFDVFQAGFLINVFLIKNRVLELRRRLNGTMVPNIKGLAVRLSDRNITVKKSSPLTRHFSDPLRCRVSGGQLYLKKGA